MSDEKNLILQKENPNLPAFMRGEEVTGMEDLGQYIIPPRVKVVQKQSGDQFSSKFDMGDTILVPMLVTVAPVIKTEKGKPTKDGEAWEFVPLFFFAEFVQWNPLETRGSLSPIRDRSVDPKSELAAKCRNAKLWFEQCPENAELNLRNVEHLNFVIMPMTGECAGTPCVISFARAEHKAGSSFASLLKMRKAPMYGTVFQAQTGFRDNGKGEWYGIDVCNPESGDGWITDEETYEAFKKIHLEMKEAHDAKNLRPDYGDETEDVENAAADF